MRNQERHPPGQGSGRGVDCSDENGGRTVAGEGQHEAQVRRSEAHAGGPDTGTVEGTKERSAVGAMTRAQTRKAP